MVLFKSFADAADGSVLVIALNNLLVDFGIRQRTSRAAPLYQPLQFVFFIEALNVAGRVVLVVPNPVLVSVAIDDDRTLPKLLFQAVGIEPRLLLADAGIALGTLGLDQSQRLAVVAPQDVIHKAFALFIGHAGDRILAVLRLVQRPSGFLEHQVNEVVAGFGFGIVVLVRGGFILLLNRRDLGPQAFEFSIELG